VKLEMSAVKRTPAAQLEAVRAPFGVSMNIGKRLKFSVVPLVFLLVLISCTKPSELAYSSPTLSPTSVDTPPALIHSTQESDISDPTDEEPDFKAQAVASPTPEQTGWSDSSLSPVGPWLIIKADDGLWSLNPDISTGKKLLDSPLYGPAGLSSRISPTNGNIVAIISSKPDVIAPRISILQLPFGESVWSYDLIQYPFDYELMSPTEIEDVTEMYSYLTFGRSFAWSPSGRYLAFVAVINNPSLDLFLYDANQDKVFQLTDGPLHAVDPFWSYDEQYVVHTVVERTRMEAAPGGYVVDSVWKAKTSLEPAEKLYESQMEYTGWEQLIQWVSRDEFLVYASETYGCMLHDVRTVNVETGTVNQVWDDMFSSLSYDGISGKLLLHIAGELDLWPTCRLEHDPGLYLIDIFEKTELSIDDSHAEYGYLEFTNYPNRGVFYSPISDGLLEISVDGDVREIAQDYVKEILVSNNGRQMLLLTSDGVLHSRNGFEFRNVFPEQVAGGFWSPNMDSIILFRQNELIELTGQDFDDLGARVILPFDGIESSPKWVIP